MYFMHEEWGRAHLAERQAEAERLRMIPPHTRPRVLLRLRGRFAVILRRLADHLEPARQSCPTGRPAGDL